MSGHQGESRVGEREGLSYSCSCSCSSSSREWEEGDEGRVKEEEGFKWISPDGLVSGKVCNKCNFSRFSSIFLI